jgi:hypothetical protein
MTYRLAEVFARFLASIKASDAGIGAGAKYLENPHIPY